LQYIRTLPTIKNINIMNKLFLLIFLILPVFSIGQSIPENVKKTVAFIYAKNDSGKIVPNGTGFFVGIQNTNDKSNLYAVYLVTAKHVLEKNKNGDYLKEIQVRLNTKDSLSKSIPVNLYSDGLNKNIFTHKDSTVDIAVIPLFPDTNIFDFLVLTNEYLTSKSDFKNLNIKEGSEIFFTGMFTPYLGDKRIYPIVRFGKVALVTDEKIPWGKGELAELYLAESSSYGGNSGSPVFFYLGANRGDGSIHVGPPIIKLAGIMKGYFGENTPIRVIETKKIPVSFRNVGIAAIVPSYLLQEIIFDKELVLKRGF